MTTYTIGISKDATTWQGASSIAIPSSTVPLGYNNSFLGLAKGTQSWPDMFAGGEPVRALDLWHAAINGRGRFYAVQQANDLEKAFRDILDQIQVQNQPEASSTGAVSGGTSVQRDVGVYTAKYDQDKHWKGSVYAAKINKTGGTTPDWGGQGTADKLPAHGSRNILTWGGVVDHGVEFKWATDESKLSNAQKLALQKNAGGTDQGATKGQQRLNYIRGDHSQETASGGLRKRDSAQGDIVNSEIWYTGKPSGGSAYVSYEGFVTTNAARTPMIYVGGNDGMLHGFDATNGVEKVAYVPRGLIPKLTLLTDPVFDKKHSYFVDGSPMTGDVFTGTDATVASQSGNWKTMLVGTLGAGGKGYFVLDVTKPAAINAASVVMDRTLASNEPQPNCAGITNTAKKSVCEAMPDIGHITAIPTRDETNPMQTSQIVQLNNDRWAVVMGNGYNSINGRPVLLVQYLDGDKKLLRLVASDATAPGNGLSAPRLVDINGDGRPDVAYAGDDKGYMWKFLLASNDDSKWGVQQWGSFGNTTTNQAPLNPKPLYVAKGPASLGATGPRGVVQPISSAPVVRANNRFKTVTVGGVLQQVAVGGMMVAFGTGRNVDVNDPQNQNVQTLYSVLDNTRYKLVEGFTHGVKDRVAVCASTSDPDCPGITELSDPPLSGPLIRQTVNPGKETGLSSARDYWKVNPPSAGWQMDWNNNKGWYMDLPIAGERLLQPMDFYDGSNVLAVFSQVPDKTKSVVATPSGEACEAAVEFGKQFLTLINIMDGKPPSVQIINATGTETFNASDKGVSRMSVDRGPQSMTKFRNNNGFDRILIDGLANNTMPEQSLRPNWRQLK